jgi:hypothetical protein
MKNNLTALLALTVLGAFNSELTTAQAQTTTFTYQGRLNDGVSPANGSYDLSFALYDDANAGGQQGGSITNSATAVSNGLFTVTLDFGNEFPGADRWLEIGVRTNGGGAFSTLAPRQTITPTPYAIMAGKAAMIEGALPASQLSGTYDSPVTISNAANVFAGDGAGLANVNAATLNGLGSSNFWQRSGNPGTIPGTHFLGTTDNQPLELKVNNARGLRLEYPTVGSTPNLVGGYGGNLVGAGSQGVVIAGGGRSGLTNSVGLDSDASVIGGGDYNRITNNARSATVSGGEYNTIGLNSIISTIGGGGGNDIRNGSQASTVAGGQANTISDGTAYGAIGGGYANGIGGNSSYAAISGGNQNFIGFYADASAIGGGWHNSIGGSGTNKYSTIAGGVFNSIDFFGGSDYSTIGGGRENQIAKNATYATIPGGGYNVATNYAFAAGYRAEARHTGAFVWADSTETNFTSTASNQFNLRASGGVRLETSGVGISLDGKQVPVGEEQLRIVRGIVRGTTASGLNKGTGYSVSSYGGTTVINFSSSFSDLPTVTITGEGAPEGWHFSVAVTTSGVTVTSRRADSVVQTLPFHFIAVGPR